MLRKIIIGTVLFAACDAAPVPYHPGPTYDMAATQPPVVNYCGSAGNTRTFLADCVQHCVPDEQVFFFCTELRGKIAYTRQGLYKPQTYGYSFEINSAQKCGDLAVAVWSLAPLQPAPTNANTGRMTWSSVDSDCSALPLKPPYIEMNLDRLYYVPVGPILPEIVQ